MPKIRSSSFGFRCYISNTSQNFALTGLLPENNKSVIRINIHEKKLSENIIGNGISKPIN